MRQSTPDQDIAEARAQAGATRRPSVAALEEILFQKLPVLDHGFIRVVDYFGDDAAVVQAARVSYGKGTRAVSSDRALIRYLMRHHHTTPFEMAEIKLHVCLPIFVARQWIRHRTASVNEVSARYSILEREFFVPDPASLAAQSASNRQGRGAPLAAEEAAQVIGRMQAHAAGSFDLYLSLLGLQADEADGGGGEDGAAPDPAIARELARIVLPLSTYTQWYWKTDLHNLMSFIRLRADPHAQAEIRAYALVLGDILHRWVPLTAEACRDYRLEAVTLSRQGVQALRSALNGQRPDPDALGLTQREWSELLAAFPELAARP